MYKSQKVGLFNGFFIADNLEDVERIEQSMELQGFADNQYHVLSENDEATERKQLHDVSSIFKRDLVHSAEVGALIGAGVAALILLLSYTAGWTTGTFGWTPAFAVALLAFCFCTWEAAFLGFQIPNSEFKRFSSVLKQGKHVFFVDLNREQLKTFEPVMKWHPELKEAGIGEGIPSWFQKSSHNIREVIKALP